MSSIYTHYRNRLIEISGKSRSLYSKTISKKQAYNLAKIFEANPDESKRFVEFLFGDKRRYKLFTAANVAAFLANNAVLEKNKRKCIEGEYESLRALQREIDFIEKETGRYELFVGYPFVEGSIGRGVTVKAPLLLFPAKIIDENGIELEILRDEPLMLNKVFLFAFAKENKLNIDNIETEFSFNDAEKTIKDATAAKEYLQSVGIPLKRPKQKHILNIEKIKELGEGEEAEIRNFAVLGRFPLANSIYNDYIQMEKNKLSSPALDALLKNKEAKQKTKDKECDFFPIHQLDFAQEQSIENINKFSNVVVYGPPGTGKSQTITNMITDAVCKNKRVLVVSQKRTALDVVYNRLGSLSGKAMILPDPEKSKNEFYEKVRARYAEAIAYKNVFSEEALLEVDKNIRAETVDLQGLSATFFTPLPFGLTLQQMYVRSARIDKNTLDYSVYKTMQTSPLINLNYPEMEGAIKSITQKNKANLFYSHYLLAKTNPVIDYIRTDIGIDKINQVRAYIGKLLNEEALPFNIAKYSHSRYMLVYNLENHSGGGLKPLANMITRLENPSLAKKTRVAGIFPLFWPAYPVFKSKYLKKRREIADKLKIAQLAVRRYISEFDLLKTVLEPSGFAMVIDNITYGNAKFLSKLMSTLDEYMALRDIILSLKSLSATERLILDFAFENTRNKQDFLGVVNLVLPIRVYHEVVQEEGKRETELAKTIVFDNIKNRIVALKAEKLKLDRDLAMDGGSDGFKKRLEENPEEGKNFLYQISKQNKLWPIRKLMQVFEPYLFDLFPCWLLSPEAVSAILPLKPDLFDTVLFDEASQIFIENTIPAIYRSKCLVVAGDNKQLRPTSVFIKRYMGDDSDMSEMSLSTQAAMEVESLLDLASSRLRPAHLTYHYRSRYEELINFSNYAFYGGRLQIAPNNSRYTRYKPIERIKVEGRWLGRKNAVEAKTVAALVGKIFETRKKNESVGIVTFNTEQEECIVDALNAKCEKEPEFKTAYLKELGRRDNGEYTGIFVKNLENVQGDERDIIIFSIGYAKNEEGKVNSQFGTLSLSGGENRLNVAITRAKEKIYLVTSVEPEEFASIETSKNLGPKLFKKYLQYVKAVSEKNTKEVKLILNSLSAKQDAGDAGAGIIEKELKNELVKLGYQVDENVGGADYKLSLAVYDPALDAYVLGLECDYAAKNSSDAVMERDVYRSNFLESRGWKIMRIWSRDYWLNKAALIKAIEKEIADCRFKLMQSKSAKKPRQSKAKQG